MWKKSLMWEKMKAEKFSYVENGYKLIKTVHNRRSIVNNGNFEIIHTECGKQLKNLSTTFPQNVDKFT